MKVVIHEQGTKKVVEVLSDEVIIHTPQDALDVMMGPGVYGVDAIILHRRNIDPSFFDLRTGLAGEVLQKFVNYQKRLAIVGDFSDITSESFKALIRESNRGHQASFVEHIEAAKQFLTKD